MNTSCSIFDLPNEILTVIIWNLNVRERVAFANASSRFHPLVFGDKQILRNLDFSKEGRLTTLWDIDQYFRNKNVGKHILKVNLTNVTCISSYNILKNTLCKAKNLVEINIQTIQLDILVLSFFLREFPQLKRLSIDWPETSEHDAALCKSAFKIPFANLVYLSVRFVRWTQYSPEFIVSVHLCEKLEELRMVQVYPPICDYQNIRTIEHKGLKNLKIVEYCGRGSMDVVNHIGFLFTNPREWNKFPIAPGFPLNGFYFEKYVEVCDMLREPLFQLAEYPLSDCLLVQVISKTCEYEVGDLCCFQQEDELPCLMKIEEMKMLLKNPRHEIRYLKIAHSIESYCSVHLLASIFPTLTELVLTNVIKRQDWHSFGSHPKTRLKRIGDPDSDDLWNTNEDSCFKMLVKNTPHLRHLTLNASMGLVKHYEKWDLDALNLIAGWKNLKSLTLNCIPITDGEFLIGIGKECVYLDKLELTNLGHWDCSYCEKGLPQMLRHCKNLKDVTIHESNVRQVSKLLQFLDNNPNLRRVSIRSRSCSDTTEKLVSSIEHLLEQCPKLNTLLCIVGPTDKVDVVKLQLGLRRLIVELIRPTLQFQLVDGDDAEDTVVEDYSPPAFPWNLDQFDTVE